MEKHSSIPFSVAERFETLMRENGFNAYRVTQGTQLSSSTIPKMLKKSKGSPNVETLYDGLQAMNVSMSQFFMERERNTLKPVEEKILNIFNSLSEKSQALLMAFLESLER